MLHEPECVEWSEKMRLCRLAVPLFTRIGFACSRKICNFAS